MSKSSYPKNSSLTESKELIEVQNSDTTIEIINNQINSFLTSLNFLARILYRHWYRDYDKKFQVEIAEAEGDFNSDNLQILNLPDSDGEMLLSWSENYRDSSRTRSGQKYKNGKAVGPKFVITNNHSSYFNPREIIILNGNLVSIWEESSPGKHYIYGQMYDISLDNPIGEKIEISDGGYAPSIVALVDGGFMVGYTKIENGFKKVTFQKYDENAIKSGPSFPAELNSTGNSYNVVLVPEMNGGFTAAWDVDSSDPDFPKLINGKRYKSFDPYGQEIDIYDDIETETHQKYPLLKSPSLATFNDSNLIFTYVNSSERNGDELFFQIFNDVGDKITRAPIKVSQFSAMNPKTISLPGGRFLVSWNEYNSINGQVFDSRGEIVGQGFEINSLIFPDNVRVVHTNDGGSLFFWKQMNYDGLSTILMQRFGPEGQRVEIDGSIPIDPYENIYRNGGIAAAVLLCGACLILCCVREHQEEVKSAMSLASQIRLEAQRRAYLAFPPLVNIELMTEARQELINRETDDLNDAKTGEQKISAEEKKLNRRKSIAKADSLYPRVDPVSQDRLTEYERKKQDFIMDEIKDLRKITAKYPYQSLNSTLKLIQNEEQKVLSQFELNEGMLYIMNEYLYGLQRTPKRAPKDSEKKQDEENPLENKRVSELSRVVVIGDTDEEETEIKGKNDEGKEENSDDEEQPLIPKTSFKKRETFGIEGKNSRGL